MKTFGLTNSSVNIQFPISSDQIVELLLNVSRECGQDALLDILYHVEAGVGDQDFLDKLTAMVQKIQKEYDGEWEFEK